MNADERRLRRTNHGNGSLFHFSREVNRPSFHSFEPGEALPLAASGWRRADKVSEITSPFAATPNRRRLTVAPVTDIRKRGWEYLWVRYADAEHSGVLLNRRVSAYVEQVYEYSNFGQLAIGS
ncbi:MAG: hypothetical protein R6V05_07735 [Candidatus Brocadiia bacterium]